MNDLMVKTASYLATLDPEMFNRYCEYRKLNSSDIVPFVFEEPAAVYDCICCFCDEGISVKCILTNTEVWYLYLRAITDEKCHNGLKMVIQLGGPGDLIEFFDTCYKFGIPGLKDADYDVLVEMYLQVFPFLSYLKDETYDDRKTSPLILEAVKLCMPKNRSKSTVKKINLVGEAKYDDLNTEKTKSIRPVYSLSDAFEFIKSSPVCDLHCSLKVDGVNTKVLFSVNGEGLELAVSRGRATDSIDYTEAIRRMLNKRDVDMSKLSGVVIGESFVSLENLSELQKRYPGKNYKSPKSTAMAMLRAPDNFTPDDYNLLSFNAFSYQEYRADEAYELLKESCLETPPSMMVKSDEVPRDSEEKFGKWLHDTVLSTLWAEGEKLGTGSDGVVIQLMADINTERKDKYTDSNIAIKFDYWSAVTYTSVVKEIVFEQRRVEASVVLVVEPVVMRDMNTATRVGVGSTDILIRDNVRVGDTIEFERKSEAYDVYLRKVSK